MSVLGVCGLVPVALIVGVIVTLVSSLFGGNHASPSPIVSYQSIDRATDALALSSSASPWKVRDLGDITLDSPLDLSTGRDTIAAHSEQTRPNLVYQEFFKSPDSFFPSVVVSRSKYTPETGFDIAIASGDPDFQFSSRVTTVDSLPARRASFSGHERDGTPLYGDVVYVQNGQQVWNLRVVYTNSSFAASSKRILDSIHIRPE
jgi:hypothetical protein